MTRLVNLTWHDIVIITQEGNIKIPKIEWFKLQLPVEVIECGTVLDDKSKKKVPLLDYRYSIAQETLDIFAPVKPGTIYISSRVVAATTNRPDFYITWAHIKIDGMVIGTKWIQKNPYYVASPVV